MYHHLIAAAQADVITPQTARYIGIGIVVLALLYWANKLFGNASN